jgi:hypothetical protein
MANIPIDFPHYHRRGSDSPIYNLRNSSYLRFLTLAINSYICRDPQAVPMINKMWEQNPNIPTKTLFKSYHSLFHKGKLYSLETEEAERRMKIFEENLKIIKEINHQKLSYKVAINHFADLTHEEYLENFLINISPNMEEGENFLNSLKEGEKKAPLFEEGWGQELVDIDHRQYILPTRQQGQCGSCWAFSTMSAIEGNLNKARNQDPSTLGYLSVQQLVDCDTYLNHGCQGGWPDAAMEYYLRQNGVVSENMYPYNGYQNYCGVNLSYTAAQVVDYEYCTNSYYFRRPYRYCSKELYNSILQNGPGVVVLDASSNGFKFYAGGVWTPSYYDCQQDNHAVTVVGYIKNEDSYIVRNSWGAQWGENGHIRIQYEPNSASCHILNNIWRPIPSA